MKKYHFSALTKLGVIMLFVIPTVLTSFLFITSANATGEAITAGSTANGEPNTSIPLDVTVTGSGNDTIPVRLYVQHGTLNMSDTTGLTFNGLNTATTKEFYGTRSDVNAALATLTYTSSSVGTDALEMSLSQPGEVVYQSNGHMYSVVPSTAISWNAANTAAEASTRYGSTGYLATITDSNENNYIAKRLSNAGWMGASDAATEDDWKWVGGPEAGISFWTGRAQESGGHTVNSMYARWNQEEPNNYDGDEDCGEYIAGGYGTWNDYPCTATYVNYYVVEYGAPGDLPDVAAATQNINVASSPSQVNSPSATAGIESAQVSFTAPNDGGSTITGYRVTASPGGASATGSASPITLNGLTGGTQYTFSVVATNAIGDSEPSNQSNAVTPTAAPSWDDDVLGNVHVGIAYNDGVSATGYPDPEYSVSSGALPDGLTLNETTGVISGIASTVGDYDFTITASNGVGSDITKTFSLLVVSESTVDITIDFKVGQNIKDGLSTTVSGEGLKPGSEYSVVLESTPRTIATGFVGANGTFFSLVYLPFNITGGSHSITVYGTSATNQTLSDAAYFRVNNSGKILAISETGAIGDQLPITGFDIFSLCVAGLLLLSSGYVLLRKTKVNAASQSEQ